MEKIAIETEKLGRPVAGDDGMPLPKGTPLLFSRGIKVGNTVYLSGVTATDSEGKLVGHGDPKLQAKQVYENIKAILEAAGASLDDVVIQRLYLTNREHISTFAEVRQKYFRKLPLPCATAVVVSSLIREGALLEVEVTAVI